MATERCGRGRGREKGNVAVGRTGPVFRCSRARASASGQLQDMSLILSTTGTLTSEQKWSPKITVIQLDPFPTRSTQALSLYLRME
jgi:hypothetical protein